MSDDFDFDDTNDQPRQSRPDQDDPRAYWTRNAQGAKRKSGSEDRIDPPFDDREPALDVEIEEAPAGPRSVSRPSGSRRSANRSLPTERVDRFEAEAEEPNFQPSRQEPTPWMLIGSIAVAVIWVAGAGFAVVQDRPDVDGLAGLLSLSIQLLAPAAFAILAGVMGDSLVRSNRRSKTLTIAAQRMLSPDRMGERAARSTAGAVRDEIGRLEAALGDVTNRLAQIENKVDEKATALRVAGETARGGAEALVATMEGERERLDSLLTALSELTSTAQRTTRNASEGIDERARELAIASETLLDRTEQASEMARSAAVRLEQASQRAMDAIIQLDEASTRGEQSLARAHDMMVMARIRADEAIGAVRGSTEALQSAADQAAGNLGALAHAVEDTGRQSNELFQQHAGISREVAMSLINDIRTAAEQSGREMVNALRTEAELARATGETTLAALRQSAETVRAVTRETSDDLTRTLDTNAQRIDGLKLSASELDAAASAALESRTAHARSLVQQSVGMLDETGEQIRTKFSAIADACADQARSVEDLLDTISGRLGELPTETEKQAGAIRAALEETLSKITQAGRRAVEETAVLDADFQKRLQDSYIAMGELVSRLGGLTGAFQPPPGLQAGLVNAGPTIIAPPPVAAPLPPPPPPPVPPTPPVNAEPTAPPTPPAARTMAPVRYNLDYRATGAPSQLVPREKAPAPRPETPTQQPPSTMLRGRVDVGRAQPTAPQTVPQTSPSVTASPDTGAQSPAQQPQAPRPQALEPTTQAKRPELTDKPVDPTPLSPPNAGNASTPNDDNPFSGVNLREIPAARGNSEVPWRWREVLSALEPEEGAISDAQVLALVKDLGLQAVIPDQRLNQMRARAVRGRDTARADAVAIAQGAVFELRTRFDTDAKLRSRTLTFVDGKRDQVKRGNLTGDLLRFYLIADAALD